jgi:hypothetical protein
MIVIHVDVIRFNWTSGDLSQKIGVQISPFQQKGPQYFILGTIQLDHQDQCNQLKTQQICFT